MQLGGMVKWHYKNWFHFFLNMMVNAGKMLDESQETKDKYRERETGKEEERRKMVFTEGRITSKV